MTLFLAVVAFALARALLAGYGGWWFLPVVACEALDAAWPLLAVAAFAALLRLRAPQRARVIDALAIGAGCAVLVARFGKGWIEPHTSLAQLAAIGAGPSVALVLAGVAMGAALAAWAARTGGFAAEAALVWLAAWLIVGPEIYARFDDVESSRRLIAAAWLAAAFAVPGALCAWAGRRSASGARVWKASVAAAAAAALLAAAAMPSAGRAAGGPSIVLVGIDTLRADALERITAQGEPLMPRLTDIAGYGVRFTQAVAPSPWTLPSFVTLLSGMNPHRHHTGRVAGGLPMRGDPIGAWSGPALRAAGYQAAAFVNNPWLRPYYGLGRGYLRFRRYHGVAADGVTLASAWIRTHRLRPFFVFLHLMDPHWPYDAPAGYAQRRPCAACDDLRIVQYQPTPPDVHDEVRRRYEAELAYTDAQVGRLFEDLRGRGVLDDAWLFVTSDHGEELWDHEGFLHGHSLYDELLRVPLIVVPPLAMRGAKRGVVATEQVRLEDVGATIFDIAGVELPRPLDGASLRAFASDRDEPEGAVARPLVAGFLQQEGRQGWAVRANGMKLIVGMAPLPLLFDLRTDAHETVPITFSNPQATAALSRIPAALGLDVTSEAPAPVPAGPADADVTRELRALGYLK